MLLRFLCTLSGVLLTAGGALAQGCTGGLPWTFSSGSVADASQVNANFNYIVTCFATLGANTLTAAQTLPGNPTSSLQAATKQYVDSSGGSSVPRRQTATAGPMTTPGAANFLPATSTSLSITSVNISSMTPLAVAAANNVSSTSGAQVDVVGVSTSNLTWSGLTASTTNFLYVTVASSALTTASTTLAPIYQWAGAVSTTAGQFTFNIAEMRGYLGNGSTAPQISAVFVGEAATGASTVTSTIGYAYNGLYESAFTGTLPAANTAVNAIHNIGVPPRFLDWIIENTTAEFNYVIGDQLHAQALESNPSSLLGAPALSANRLTMSMIGTGAAPWSTLNKTAPAGSQSPLTAASWRYKFVAQRGW